MLEESYLRLITHTTRQLIIFVTRFFVTMFFHQILYNMFWIWTQPCNPEMSYYYIIIIITDIQLLISMFFQKENNAKHTIFFFHTLLNSKLVNKIKIIFNLYFNVYSCYFIIESNNLNIKCKYIVGIRTNYHGPNIYYYYWA